MRIPEIIEVKEHLEKLMAGNVLTAWELPYENILTRRSAAIFFINPSSVEAVKKVEEELAKYPNFSHRPNIEQNLSLLPIRVTFSEEEKAKNANVTEKPVVQ